ncbi:MAG: homoserine O-acetyltransferase [Armatimonadota bacterium]|nr:homoserine O-acetyltransferase [Armatimonadota bacterium]
MSAPFDKPLKRWETEGGALDAGLFDENARLTAGVDPLFAQIGDFVTTSGAIIKNATIAYQTFGEFTGDNAILICHALTGTSNVVGWWDRIVGPGLAIDTDKYFVIGNNLLGGCQGSTGPSTVVDGAALGSGFPVLTIEDQVSAQAALLPTLGVENLRAVVGCSTGGFHALEWATQREVPVVKVVISASGPRQNARQLALNEAARQAIMRDPKWLGGDYPLNDPPSQGLALARMIGHIAYLSGQALETKFGRSVQNDKMAFTLDPTFSVESYLNYQGDKFTDRFDANSLLILTRAANFFDLQSLDGALADFLFIAFTSDTLFPVSMSRELHEMARSAGLKSRVVEIDLPFGHDAFLLDGDEQGAAIREFLHT